MENVSLFNPGFLGSNFNWWIGQIPDDSTWRENINSTKHENPADNLGWGSRYKVRIIGIHDKEEESVPSDQLPWANVMYPVTAGSGHASTGATSAIRQGSFVFGFFLDGAEQQIPVIMGVLGNNVTTALSRTIGTTQSNFAATSGFSQGTNPDSNIKAPEYCLAIDKNANVAIESPSNPHQSSVADIKRDELYNKKIVLMTPCDLTGSALKAIHIKIQEITQTIRKYLSAGRKYLDAATNIISQIQSYIANVSCEIAKYVSFLFTKAREFVIKKINSLVEPTIQTIPPNKRNLYATIKEKIIEIIYCIFNGIIDQLCGQIEDYLNQKLNYSNFPDTSLPSYTQISPPCTSEQMCSDILASNMPQIDNGIQSALNILNTFLADVSNEIAVAGGVASTVESYVSKFDSSINQALNFTNIRLNVFGCDLQPKCSFTDHYDLNSGGKALDAVESPSLDKLSVTSNQKAQQTGYSTSEYLVPPLSS